MSILPPISDCWTLQEVYRSFLQCRRQDVEVLGTCSLAVLSRLDTSYGRLSRSIFVLHQTTKIDAGDGYLLPNQDGQITSYVSSLSDFP
jgi:hypothetical protein